MGHSTPVSRRNISPPFNTKVTTKEMELRTSVAWTFFSLLSNREQVDSCCTAFPMNSVAHCEAWTVLHFSRCDERSLGPTSKGIYKHPPSMKFSWYGLLLQNSRSSVWIHGRTLTCGKFNIVHMHSAECACASLIPTANNKCLSFIYNQSTVIIWSRNYI